jgi:glycosyltransferase involved in cell wall biosynthesis
MNFFYTDSASESGNYRANSDAEYRQSISIIFPAFNEEENIARAVEHARETISKFFNDIEIIVVNDGSSDTTGAIIDKMAAVADDVIPIHHQVNRGYGAALRSGIYKASKGLIFFTDSDLQFDLKEIEDLEEWIHDYDIVAGYRAKRADPVHRRFNAWGWNMLVRLVLGLKVKDIDCAFKLFRRDVFANIKLETVGAMINTEILTMAQRNAMRIKEVPVSHYPRLAGEQTGANLKVILKALRELFLMREKLKLRTGEIRRDTFSYKSRYNDV